MVAAAGELRVARERAAGAVSGVRAFVVRRQLMSPFWWGVLVGAYVGAAITILVVSALVLSGRHSGIEDVESDKRAWLARDEEHA